MSSTWRLFGSAILLGIVQGLTEFLPVSSSGHLVIVGDLLGFTPSLLYDVILHGATLLPVLWIYRSDIWQMCSALGRLPHGRALWATDRGLRLLVAVLIGTVPTALMGVGLERFFEELFASPRAVGAMFLVTGFLLFLPRLFGQQQPALDGEEPADSHLMLTPWRALLVGIAQGLAITPGISRSGTTITAALLLGIERTMAARLSFLLAIPAVGGAFVLHLRKASLVPASALLAYGVGALAAVVSGYLAVRWLVKLVRRGALHRFTYYLWPAGVAVLLYMTLR